MVRVMSPRKALFSHAGPGWKDVQGREEGTRQWVSDSAPESCSRLVNAPTVILDCVRKFGRVQGRMQLSDDATVGERDLEYWDAKLVRWVLTRS